MKRSTISSATHQPRVLASNLWRDDRVLLMILAAAALLGLVYNFVILKGFGPDEMRHFNYVKLLLEERSFPLLMPNGQEYRGAHSQHPPLYYLYQAPFYLLGGLLPGGARWHLMRLGSLLLCLSALPLVYDIARRALNGSRPAARLATAHLALLPIFGMTAGIINNDSATLFACILFLWLLLRHPLAGGMESGSLWRATIVLGAVFGLGALCKGSALPVDAAALLAAFWLGRKRSALSTKAQWQHLGVALLVAGVIAAPWYLRNHAIYGSFQPIPAGYTNAALPNPSTGMLTMMMHDNFPPLFLIANHGIFISQWSQKDWIPETLRAPIYLVFLLYCGVAALALMRAAWRRNRLRRAAAPTDETARGEYSQDEESSRAAGIIALVPYPVMWLLCLQIALFVHWGQAEGGRYLLPAFAGFAVWLAAGWQSLVGEKRLKITLVIWCAAMIALNVLAVYWLLSYLNPTFGPQR